MRPTALRVEHLDEALGITVARPRLSWRLPPGAREQLAYRVTAAAHGATVWDTGRVESGQSLLVPYEGRPARAGERVTWRVKLWSDAGESPWSKPCWFEAGLGPEDWTATWIEPADDGADDGGGVPGERPAVLFRTETTLARARSARLHVTAHGLYEAFVNGVRVGDQELTPGYTQYEKRLQVQTFDVTDLMRPGPNALGVIVADGWYRGQVGLLRAADQWGERLALLAQLQVDGATPACTDGTWRSGAGHVTRADLIAGETQDLTKLPRGWSEPGFDDSAWTAARTAEHGYATLTGPEAPPVRRVEELEPVAVTQPRPGVQVIDLGRNINGWLRLRSLGPVGTSITLTHGEALGPDGDVTMEHLRPDVPFLDRPLEAGQVDRVVSAGVPDERFEPRRTTHGFRYARVAGHPDALTPDDVRGVFVHSDLRRTGWFRCSDPRVEALHEAVVTSLRGNLCDIPTDCPTRERAGWTGDWQLFVPTAAFLYDVAGFSTKWLRDVAADQFEDGTVANLSPLPPAEGRDAPLIGATHGAAGWGDAAVVVPWELYRSYGDERVLAEQWPSMVAWVERAARVAREHRHPSREARSAEPLPHEKYLWDTGFHWGEWLEPGVEVDFGSLFGSDHAAVGTAYLSRSARLLSRIATVLGRAEDAAAYAALADGARDAWRVEFLRPDGTLVPQSQAEHVRALAFGLVPDEHRATVADRLAELVRDAGTHLGTGFLSTPDLLPVLAAHGHADVAFDLLLQDSPPSWLAMIDRGATTVWESWEGVDADGVPHASLNHYSKGAVVSFLHRVVGGVELTETPGGHPAYRRFRIAPLPGGGITWAETELDSPYGRIAVHWRVDGTAFTLEVEVPPGTRADVVLPDGSRHEAGPGRHEYSSGL